MPCLSRFPRALAPLALAVSTVTACSLTEDPTSPETLRRQAEQVHMLHFAMPPANACPHIAQMLSWCANGPSYHYRCTIAADNSRATLTGTLEAVVRADTFLVIDFNREGGGSSATLHQNGGMLRPDFAPLIETNLNNPDCRRGGRGAPFG